MTERTRQDISLETVVRERSTGMRRSDRICSSSSLGRSRRFIIAKDVHGISVYLYGDKDYGVDRRSSTGAM